MLERDDALAMIRDAAASAAATRGRALVISGPPGIGKTRLLDAAARGFSDAGTRVLWARGAESETGFPFAGALQLLERSAQPFLTGAAELARPVLDGAFLSGDGGPVASAIHGLFWLTINLSTEGLVALVIDDLHALDEPTLRYLLYLQRRIEELPVLMLAATRPPETQGRPALSELVLAPGVDEIALAPLSEAAVTELVRAELDRDADEDFCRACARVSGGNPFLLGEALRELRAEGAPATREGARRLADIEPRAVSRAVLLRLARLPEAAGRLASAAAVLGPGTPLRLVAELAGIEPEDMRDAADALFAAAILDTVDPVSFAHGLIGAAIAADLSVGQRGRLHLQAARALIAAGAPPERVATHLLSAPPTAEAQHLDILSLAAEHALSAGVPASAAAYLQRALESATDPGRRAELLLLLARAEVGIAPEAAGAHLAQALELGPSGDRAGQLQLALGRALYVAGRHAEAAQVFLAGAESLPTEDPLARELAAWFISASVFVADQRPRAVELAGELAVDPPTDPTPAERAVLAQVAVQHLFDGGALRAVRGLVDLAWGDGELLRQETCDDYSWMHVTAAFLWGGDYGKAGAIAEMVLEDARRRGSVMATATASYIHGSAALWHGRLLDAVADFEQTLEIARRDGWNMFLGAAQSVLAEARIERGELDDAERALSLLGDDRYASSSEGLMLLARRARLHLFRGRFEAALADVRTVAEQAEALGIFPPRLLGVWDVEAEALARLGRRAEALEVLDAGAVALQRAELPGFSARLLVVRSRLTEREAAVELARRALAMADEGQARLESTRAAIALGVALRRVGQRREAETALRDGLDLAHRLGAAPLEEIAREELAVLGRRPRRMRQWGAESLTASELRTARLAARGMTNREIAEALFVTPKTVEYHLRNVFQKLDIASRTELAGVLAEAG